MLVESAALNGLRASIVPGDGDNDWRGRAKLGAQSIGQLSSVCTRHRHVEERHLRPVFASDSERRFRVISDPNFLSEFLEQAAEHVGDISLIVDDENTA